MADAVAGRATRPTALLEPADVDITLVEVLSSTSAFLARSEH
jgi:hypothetical protein